jgi:hypothetical protein
MASLFFSYSHRDEDYRNELEVHLAMLKREGLIDAWHDRRLTAGSELDAGISEHLEKSQIILCLVSPYFLSSDYCYQIEMSRALERHKLGQARVIPVIVHPCDWANSPLRSLRATPLDGKPISKFPNVHDAYLQIVEDIRGAAKELGLPTSKIEQEDAPSSNTASVARTNPARSSNLRLKREFNDHERDVFLDEAFEFIANYFESSLVELQQRNVGLETRFRRMDQAHFTATIYIRGEKRSACRVWLGGLEFMSKGIFYSASDTGRDNSWNDSLNVTDDGYQLLLEGSDPFQGTHPKGLTFEGGAEYLWTKLIEHLQ